MILRFQNRPQKTPYPSQTCIESYSAATSLSSCLSAGDFDVCKQHILLKKLTMSPHVKMKCRSRMKILNKLQSEFLASV